MGHLSNPPDMAYPDFSKAFNLHTGASKDGLGAVLYQNQGEVMRVNVYATRALSPAEKKYHLHAGKLEFLAVKRAVTDQFSDKLYCSPKFSTGLRWVNELAHFHFVIRYRPNKANADADTLSSMPVSFEHYMKGCSEVVNQDVLDAVTSSINETNTVETAWLSSLTAVPDMLREGVLTYQLCHMMNLGERDDPTIARVLRSM